MDITQAVPRRGHDPQQLLLRALLGLLAAAVSIAAGFVLFLLAVRLLFWGQALPGVQAAGLDVSGMNRQQIELALGERLTYAQSGLIVLRDGNRQWLARPEQLGVVIDIPAMAEAALAVGRQGGPLQWLDGQLRAWTEGRNQPVIVLFDQRAGRAYLQSVAAEVDRPTIEAELTIEGQQVRATPGQVGRQIDLAASLEALTPLVWRQHDGQVDLVVREAPPIVLSAAETAEVANRLLAESFVLAAAEDEPADELAPSELAAMLHFEADPEQGVYLINADASLIGQRLEPLGPELARNPENARFIFNDDTRQLDLLKPAVIGRDLNIEASIEAINRALSAGQHRVTLAFDTTDPQVRSDATAESLGITENVVATSTYFAGSSGSRIQNIGTAAEAFHGLLVAPGETLSMAEVLGDISLDKGYAEALIIFGNRTIKGVGGGVCQVSTTLFRAAFHGGYQIDERHPHAYRVLYYESGPGSPGPGLDATVFVPLVDFKFTNDSEYWLLLETYLYGNQLLWKFYSTSDGRSVSWTSTGPRNVVEAPEPLYKENDELDEGEIEQVDWEADGMDVTVTRTVTRDGVVIHDDVIRTHYLPWRAIYEYGPGTELPDDANTEE
jgi:vancomycin resistance protein YoaR